MKKILIIEDDPIVAHIYKTRLEREDYQVELAEDGQSGFYRIHELLPDAVLLDLMLPRMNGVDVLRKIRADAPSKKVPIIVFTNAYVPNMINDAFQAGATQVFNKATLTPRQILDALHNAILYASGDAPAGSGGAPPESNAPDGDEPFASGKVTRLPGSEAAAGGFPDFEGAAAPDVLRLPQNTSAEDAQYQAELHQGFIDAAPETLSGLRRALQEFTKAPDEDARLPQLLALYRRIHSLTGSAGIAGLYNVSQIAAALEVLLKELHEKPKNINASTMRTVAHSIDFIAELVQKNVQGDLLEAQPVNILVVDDEILSRRAVTYALEKAGLKSVSVEEPQTALSLASEKSFDLIFLDVQMPGIDGFELCTKIRALPNNKATPVIFVTSLTDFKSRARSSLSGGTDFIAKPFMFIELSVKALTYVLRSRLSRQ